MRVRIFNVKYSPNLGDGVIAVCLERRLTSLLSSDGQTADVASIDLAGRQQFGEGLGGRRQAVLRLLEALPPWLSRLIVRFVLNRQLRSIMVPRWRAELAGCEAVVFGGGQIFADQNLNFPLKIAAAAAEARAAGARIAVFGVGVAKYWSRDGRRLFAEALYSKQTAYLAVRDAESLANFRHHFPDSEEPVLCHDPGLLVSSLYPATPKPQRARPLIGLGIVHPLVLRLHGIEAELADRSIAALFVGIVEALGHRGFDVACFTNGAWEDEAFLAELGPRLIAASAGTMTCVKVKPRPTAPEELASMIAGFDGVIAHRLHASIIGYSYGIPHVGLGWDAKVAAFFETVGREAFAVEPGNATAAGIVDTMRQALAAGIDDAGRRAVIAACDADIQALAQALRGEGGG